MGMAVRILLRIRTTVAMRMADIARKTARVTVRRGGLDPTMTVTVAMEILTVAFCLEMC